ncbi:MAG: hypothetical protein RL300_1197 [Pseudomonadota bacterium]
MSVNKNSLGFLLADVTRQMRRAFEKRLAGSFLTLAQARVLVYVSRQEGIRQIDLAELLDVQPITLTRLIDQLVSGGVLERRPDPTDRRAYQLYLLPSAKAHLESIEEVTRSIREEALDGLTERQVSDLLTMLQKMHDKLSVPSFSDKPLPKTLA